MKSLAQTRSYRRSQQGSDVRIVLKTPEITPNEIKTLDEGQMELKPLKPRFEDAFIDILGGGPGGILVACRKDTQSKMMPKIVIEAEI